MNTGRRKLELLDFLETDLMHNSSPDWTLAGLIAVLRRRRGYLLVCTAFTLLLATGYCLLATPRFQAAGEIEVQRESPAAFGLESSVTGDVAAAANDSLDYSLTLETEARILQSPTLALQVIKDLNLEATHDYFPRHPSGFLRPASIFFWRKPVEPLTIRIDDAPNRRYAALKIFASRLKVTAESGTRLIEVSYSDSDPRLAASVVNGLLHALTDYTWHARFQATADASAWLASQLTELRRQTKSLQDKASRLQHDAGIYGDDAAHNIVLDRLDALNARVTAAESNRLLSEAIDRISQSGDPELLSALAGSTSALAAPALGNSVALVQTLRGKQAEVRAQIAEADARYGPAHPRVAELHSELDGIDSSIHDEVVRIGQRSHADLAIAQAAEAAAHDAFDQQKNLAGQLGGKAVAYQLARQDAESSRVVYGGLLARLKQAAVLEGLRSTNLTVVNPARVPPTDRPGTPSLPIAYAAALFGGLFLGSIGAVAAELSDQTVGSLDGLERLTGAQLLGALPHMPRGRRPRHMLPAQSSASPSPLFLEPDNRESGVLDARFIESLRSLRTSLLLLRTGRRSQVVLVTSSVAGEGKSKVAVNLAGVLAQLGARVLLVDADLRRPSVHEELHLHCAAGLGAALMGRGLPEIHIYEPLNNLSVLCGQEPARMPAELLASARMAELLQTWRAEYDYVLLDSPPVLPATDALVLSQLSDVALLIARHGFTPRPAVHRTVTMLRDQIPETCLMRLVLNDVHADSYDFREYYGYKPPAVHAARTH